MTDKYLHTMFIFSMVQYLFQSNYVKLFVEMNEQIEDALIAVFKENSSERKAKHSDYWKNV